MPDPSPVTVRPRSAIADAELARWAVTDLPGSHLAALRDRGIGPRRLVRSATRLVRAAGRPLEPERALVMPLATQTSPLRRRRRV